MEPLPREGGQAKTAFSDQSVSYVRPNSSIENPIKVEASISLVESSVISEGADTADALLVSGYI